MLPPYQKCDGGTIASNAGVGATTYGNVIDARGYKKAWLEVTTAGFAAGTDFVGNLAGGNATGDASGTVKRQFKHDGEPLPVSLPTGLSENADGVHLTAADTFATNSVFWLYYDRVPPFVVAHLDNTSGGATAATVKYTWHLFM